MKLTTMLLTLLLISGSAFGAFTASEESDLKQIAANKDKLIQMFAIVTEMEALAAESASLVLVSQGLTNETVPIQIAQKRDEITILIAVRDADMAANDVANAATNKAIFDLAELAIDSVESEISTLQAQI